MKLFSVIQNAMAKLGSLLIYEASRERLTEHLEVRHMHQVICTLLKLLFSLNNNIEAAILNIMDLLFKKLQNRNSIQSGLFIQYLRQGGFSLLLVVGTDGP